MSRKQSTIISLTTASVLVGVFSAYNYTTQDEETKPNSKIYPKFGVSISQRIVKACPQLENVKLKEIPYENPLHSMIPDYEIIGEIPQLREITLSAIFNTSFKDIPALLKTLFGWSQPPQITEDLKNLQDDEHYLIRVESTGGSFMNAWTKAQNIIDSDGIVITYTDHSSSAATFPSLAGDFGYRFVDINATTYLHAVRDLNDAFFAEDYSENHPKRKAYTKLNDDMRQYYQDRSATGLTAECTDELVKGKGDSIAAAISAIKLGLFDIGVNKEKSTLFIRSDDINTENALKQLGADRTIQAQAYAATAQPN